MPTNNNLTIIKVIVLLAILTTTATANTCDFVNTLPTCNTDTNTIPKLPLIFQTRIEINYLTENRSATTRWFYDREARKAAIEVVERGKMSKLIFNYETDELFEIIADNDGSGEAVSNVEPMEGRPLYSSECSTTKLSDYNKAAMQTIYDFGHVYDSQGVMMPNLPDVLFKFYAQVCRFRHIWALKLYRSYA